MNRILAAVAAGVLASGLSTVASAQTLSGRWSLAGAPTVVRFEPCGAATCGVLETSQRIQADADARDIRNKDPKLRDRRLKGLPIFQELKPAGAGAWKGRVYLPGAGATYGVTVSQAGEGVLTAKGCAAPLLCQTSTLKRLP